MITILGGGISGLLAAWVLRRQKPLLLEAAPTLGGNFTKGGLKYIRRTDQSEAMLRELGINFTVRRPRGMLHVAPTATVVEHPGWFNELGNGDRENIQRRHWLKTRGTAEGFRADCMNDPRGNGGDELLECDLQAVMDMLALRASSAGVAIRLNASIGRIDANSVTNHGVVLRHDHLVPTIPLAVLSSLAPWANLPKPKPNTLGIVEFNTVETPPAWDYMYIPYADMVSRIVWSTPGVFQAEMPDVSQRDRAMFGFMEACDALTSANVSGFTPELSMSYKFRTIPGHLPPLNGSLDWPSNWFPLGRFTQWEPRATSERVLEDALRIRAALT